MARNKPSEKSQILWQKKYISEDGRFYENCWELLAKFLVPIQGMFINFDRSLNIYAKSSNFRGVFKWSVEKSKCFVIVVYATKGVET